MVTLEVVQHSPAHAPVVSSGPHYQQTSVTTSAAGGDGGDGSGAGVAHTLMSFSDATSSSTTASSDTKKVVGEDSKEGEHEKTGEAKGITTA